MTKNYCVVIFLVFLFNSGCTTLKVPNVAVASAHPLATQAGIDILNQGGNAFDAAVAVSAALAVVEPYASGLGGGGFWLLHRSRDDKDIMLDGRERAPLAATQDMYLDQDGKFDSSLSLNGALSAGIPGLPAAIVHLAENYGHLPLSESLRPAISYARRGFQVSDRYRKMLKFRLNAIKDSTSAAQIFLQKGQLPELGFSLVQIELADTLEQIATKGREGFYAGEVAANLVNGVRAAGGIWALRDLAEYRVIERQPIKGVYKGIQITSAPPPSSGGVVLIEALNILSGYDLNKLDEISRKHLIVEAMRRAYHDRSVYLGDPDFIKMPLKQLLSLDYAAGLRSTMRVDRTLPSELFAGVLSGEKDGEDTTHFSIIDQEGNRVSATLSINYPFGSAFMPPNTGILLNDEMDDFSSQSGVPNAYGLVGYSANSIFPGKRMLSSMTPTFLEDGDRVAILGTPGGSRIISMVLLAVLDFAGGNDARSWVSVPRFHHQYLPDKIQFETGALSFEEIEGLKKLGHSFKALNRHYGNMHGVLWDKKAARVTAASDPRGDGLAVVR